jgi:hypothetical protein
VSDQQCFNFLKDIPLKYFEGGRTPQQVFDQIKSLVKQDTPGREALIERLKDDLMKEFDPTPKKVKNWQKTIAIHQTVEQILTFDNPKNGTISFLTGVFGKEMGRRLSVAALQTADLEVNAAEIVKGLKQHNVLEHLNNLKGTQAEIDVVQAMMDIDSAPTEESRIIARIINKQLDKGLDLINKYGADIKKKEGFIATQTHNPEKLLQPRDSFKESMIHKFQLIQEARSSGLGVSDAYKAAKAKIYISARERWKTYIKPRLDREKTYRAARGTTTTPITDEQFDDMLNHVWDSLLSSVRGKLMDVNTSISQQINKRRILHFKDGASWMEYSRQYGSGSIIDSVIHTMRSQSNDYINLKTFGDKPYEAYAKIKKAVAEKHKDDPFIMAKLNHADKYFKTVMHEDAIPHSYLGAKISSNIRMMQNLTKLSLVMLISLSDHAQAISALRSHGMNVFDRYGLFFKTYLDSVERSTRKEVGDALGTTALHTLGAYQTRFAAADTPMGKIASIQQLMFKLNGQTWFDNALRGGFATGIARNLAMNADKEFEKLDPKLQRTAGGYGLGKEQWDLIRSNKESMKAVNGQHFITPDMVHTFTDESIDNYAGYKTTADEKESIKQDMQDRLATFFSDQTDLAQMRMGASERAMIYRGTQPGTVMGELLRFLGQFKFYGLGVTRRALGRIIKETDGADTFHGLTDYMAAALAFGFISNSAQQFVKNGSVPNPENWQTIVDSINEGGGLGMYGSLLLENHAAYGHTFVGDTLGPVAGEINDLYKLGHTLVDFSNKGHRTTYHQRATKALLQFGSNHMLLGLAVTKNVISKQLYNLIMGDMDPGYVQRQKDLAKKNDNIQVIPFNN